MSQHTLLSGDITLPWRCEALQGAVQVLWTTYTSFHYVLWEERKTTPKHLKYVSVTTSASFIVKVHRSIKKLSSLTFLTFSLMHMFPYSYLVNTLETPLKSQQLQWHLLATFFLELLHYESDSAGRIQETLLVCQLTCFHDAGEGTRLLWLWWWALPDPLSGLRRSGENGTCVDEGTKTVFPCKSSRLCACLQSQQAFR